MPTDILGEALYTSLQVLLGLSLGFDVCFLLYLIFIIINEKRFRWWTLGEWKALFYVTLYVGGFFFVGSFLMSYAMLSRDAKDQQIANACTAVSLGDTFIINDTEIVIGTGYAVGYTTGVKGLRREYSYEVTSIFVNGVPVSEYHGYKIIKDSHLREFLCSPEAIDDLY